MEAVSNDKVTLSEVEGPRSAPAKAEVTMPEKTSLFNRVAVEEVPDSWEDIAVDVPDVVIKEVTSTANRTTISTKINGELVSEVTTGDNYYYQTSDPCDIAVGLGLSYRAAKAALAAQEARTGKNLITLKNWTKEKASAARAFATGLAADASAEFNNRYYDWDRWRANLVGDGPEADVLADLDKQPPDRSRWDVIKVWWIGFWGSIVAGWQRFTTWCAYNWKSLFVGSMAAFMALSGATMFALAIAFWHKKATRKLEAQRKGMVQSIMDFLVVATAVVGAAGAVGAFVGEGEIKQVVSALNNFNTFDRHTARIRNGGKNKKPISESDIVAAREDGVVYAVLSYGDACAALPDGVRYDPGLMKRSKRIHDERSAKLKPDAYQALLRKYKAKDLGRVRIDGAGGEDLISFDESVRAREEKVANHLPTDFYSLMRELSPESQFDYLSELNDMLVIITDRRGPVLHFHTDITDVEKIEVVKADVKETVNAARGIPTPVILFIIGCVIAFIGAGAYVCRDVVADLWLRFRGKPVFEARVLDRIYFESVVGEPKAKHGQSSGYRRRKADEERVERLKDAYKRGDIQLKAEQREKVNGYVKELDDIEDLELDLRPGGRLTAQKIAELVAAKLKIRAKLKDIYEDPTSFESENMERFAEREPDDLIRKLQVDKDTAPLEGVEELKAVEVVPSPNIEEKKKESTVTGCCHVAGCPALQKGLVKTDANHACNLKCGGHHCTHWATCVPTAEAVVTISPLPGLVSVAFGTQDVRVVEKSKKVSKVKEEAPTTNKPTPATGVLIGMYHTANGGNIYGTVAKVKIDGKKYYALTQHQFKEVVAGHVEFGYIRGEKSKKDDRFVIGKRDLETLAKDARFLNPPPTANNGDDGVALIPANHLAFSRSKNAAGKTMAQDPLHKDLRVFPVAPKRLTGDAQAIFFGIHPDGAIDTITACTARPNGFRVMHNASTKNFSCGGFLVVNNFIVGIHYGFDDDASKTHFGDCINICFSLTEESLKA